MSKLPFVVSAIALAALAGCATESRVAPAPAPVIVQSPPTAVIVPQNTPAGTAVVVPQPSSGSVVVAPSAPAPLRAGTGRIESILDLPASAAAGSGVPDANKRVGLRMDDGTLQYVDTGAGGLAIGDRIAITNDGYLRHPAP
ncbi:MAG: hypothetical protein ABR570_09820 [Burkholderiales bacterium]